MRTQLFPLAVLGTLAGLTTWLAMTSQIPIPVTLKKRPLQADLVVEHFYVQSWKPLEQVHQTLSGHWMAHYPQEAYSLMREVNVTHEQKGRPFVRVQAPHGKRVEKTDTVYLWGGVTMNQAAQARQAAIEIQADQWTIQPNTTDFEAQGRVFFQQANNTMHAARVVGNHQKQHYAFYSGVKAVYARKP